MTSLPYVWRSALAIQLARRTYLSCSASWVQVRAAPNDRRWQQREAMVVGCSLNFSYIFCAFFVQTEKLPNTHYKNEHP